MAATTLSVAEWERIEREEHDLEYYDSVPYVLDVQKFVANEDYCYKQGCRVDRGHRTRKVFEAMPLDSLKGKHVLDIGCGNGKYSVLFALKGAEVSAFDISPVGVRRGQELAEMNGVAERCRFSVQNASHMEYPDNHFDIVLLHEVLHHAIKYPGVREEVLRVLKPGGKAIIAESLYGNILFDIGRSITMQGKEAKGDVILTVQDIRDFAAGFTGFELEMMSLFFMSKRLFAAKMDLASVRGLMYLMKKLDDVVLNALPVTRRYCGECVAVLTK